MNHHEFLALQTHIRHRIDELQALVEQRSDTLAAARRSGYAPLHRLRGVGRMSMTALAVPALG